MWMSQWKRRKHAASHVLSQVGKCGRSASDVMQGAIFFFFFMVGCREAAHAAVWSCPCLQCHSGRRRTHATWSQCLLNFSFSLRLTQICICRKRKVVQRLWWNPPFTVDGVDVLSSYKWAISFSHSLLMLQTLRFSAEMLWYCITIWDFCQVLPFRQHIWRTGAFKHGNCLVPS